MRMPHYCVTCVLCSSPHSAFSYTRKQLSLCLSVSHNVLLLIFSGQTSLRKLQNSCQNSACTSIARRGRAASRPSPSTTPRQEFGGMVRLLPRQRRAAHAPIHARGLSPLADWRASQETPRRGCQGVGVQATGSGSSPRGRAGSLQPVVHVRPGHSSESLPTPWLQTTPPPTAPGCHLSMASVAPGQAVTQDGTCLRLPDPQVRLQKVDGQDQGGRGEVGANQEVTELIVCH